MRKILMFIAGITAITLLFVASMMFVTWSYDVGRTLGGMTPIDRAMILFLYGVCLVFLVFLVEYLDI